MYYFKRTAFIVLFFSSTPVIVFSQNDSIAKTDSALLKQIEQQMNSTVPSPRSVSVRTTPLTLPDISVIGDFQASYHNNVKRNFDAGINEVELSMQSVVDPYARADFFFTVGKDPETGKFSWGLEEGYLTTLSLPAHLQLKAGKFKSAMGRINPVHPHALPFISLPNAYKNYFGEGINDEGASLSWLLPNSLFFIRNLLFSLPMVRLTIPVFRECGKHLSSELAHLKNFFDLSANATLELGLSGITGANNFDLRTNIAAVDLTYQNGNRCNSILTNPLHGSRKPGLAMQTSQEIQLQVLSACIPLSIFNSQNACFLPACTVIQTNPIHHILLKTPIPQPSDGMPTEFRKWKLKEKQQPAIWKKNNSRSCFAGFLLSEHTERININY